MAKLEAQEIEFAYNTAPVLRGLDLSLGDGESAALVGPNGSGKTTLLRVLCGLLQPGRGHVWLDGQRLDRLSRRDIARQIAVVPQDIAVPYNLNVRDVVLLGRTPYIRPLAGPGHADYEAVARALRLTNTQALAGRAFNQLSGGERQRVVLAMALAQEPQVLLLDEPIVHLDINHQIEMMELIVQLKRERGLTLLATLHDLNLAAQYLERIVLLKNGQILAQGAPAQVITAGCIRQAYGADVTVIPHPANQQPVVLLGANSPPQP